MKRKSAPTLLAIASLVGLGCSSTNDSGGEETATGGFAANTAVGTTGGAAGTGATSPATGGTTIASTGGAGNASTGGVTDSGTGGVTDPGTGGATDPGTGGATDPGTGGATDPGTGGSGAVATGGSESGGTGGSETAGTGGGSATGGTGPIDRSNPIDSGSPQAVDVTDAAAGIANHYYISNAGDDANSGTSPDQPWATFTNIPRTGASVIFLERGGQWTFASSLSLTAGSVLATYGNGPRPLIYIQPTGDGRPPSAGVMLGGENLVDGIMVKGEAIIAFPVGSDGNIVQNCEVDGAIEGEEFGVMQLGFSVRGEHNLITGNYVHDLSGVTGDTGNYNTSGGSEAFIVNASYNEVSYNSAVNCWTPNETLNGAEGGCLEIIVPAANMTVENIFFHHNYCERSVGLFEACAGNFGGDEPIQLNHAGIKDSYLAYNVAVDAMWLYLLQTVNTDMDNLVFEHNTLTHGPANDDIPQGGAGVFGIYFDQDPLFPHQPCASDAECGTGLRCLERQGEGTVCTYEGYPEPGQITVRNNLFAVFEGGGSVIMELPPGESDAYGNVFSPSAPFGATGNVTTVADPGLVDSFRLGPDSPLIDAATPEAWQEWTDFDGNPVPCGAAPDVGAVEYCP